jgi:hypothetical protein
MEQSMAIAHISVGDVESITKINSTIDMANVVPQKADVTALASETSARQLAIVALPLAELVNTRPGEAVSYFTPSLDDGDPSALASVDATKVRYDDSGIVIRQTGDGIVASRALYPLEPGRKYLVEYAVQRRVNSPDPDNDAIRCGLAWYDQTRSTLSQVVVQDLLGITVGSGRVTVSAVVSRAAASDVAVVSPANARYCRPFVQTYGTLVQSDIEVIRWTDITNASAYSPDLTALTGQVTALESVDAGDRLTALEGQVTSPNAMRLATKGDLVAANIPVSADTVELLGYADPDDGGRLSMARSSSEPTHALKTQSSDGAWWEVIDTTIQIEQVGGFRGADCSAVAQIAVDYLKYRGGGKLCFERAGTYILTSVENTSDSVEIYVKQGVTIQHNPLATASMIKATGSKGFQSAITASVNALDTSVPVADASGFAAGDWVILKDTTDYSTDSAAIGYKSGESLVIKSITSNTLYFDRKIFGSWQSDFSYTVARGGNVQKVVPVKNFRVTGDGKLVGFQTQNISLVEMAYVDGARFLGPDYNTFAGPGVLYRTCRNIEHKPGNVADGRNDTANGFPGYGVAAWGACDVGRIYGGFYTRTRHAFTTMGSLDGGPSRIYVTGNIVSENDFTGLDTHEGTHEITFDGNKVYGGNAANGSGGINSRSPTTRIIHNDVVGVPGNGISAVGQALRSLLIRGNSVEDCDSSGIAVSSTVRGLYIFDNVVKNSGLHGISCLGVSYDTGISRVNVAGNKVIGWGRLAASRSGIQVVTTTASAGYVEYNIVDAVNGTEGRGIYISAAALTGSVSNNKLRGTYSIAPLPIPTSMLGDGNEWDGAPNFERVTIPIDGFYLLPGVTTVFQQITIGAPGSGGNQPNGIFAARVSATPGIIAVSTFGANVILTTGTLNGSTGTTGNFTISAGTTGVYFENRTSAAITVTIQTKNRL